MSSIVVENAGSTGGGGGAPSGPAGGDLGGTYPNPTVTAGHFGGSPGQYLKNSAGVWVPANIAYTDVSGTPTSLPPSGSAGGDLGSTYPNPTVVGGAHITTEVTGTDFKPSGLTGATGASRYVGATASGAPTSGTFAVGDHIVDQTGKMCVCTVAGTPGTWVQVGAGGSGALTLISDQTLGSAVATVTFSSIPGTYNTLLFRIVCQLSAAIQVWMRFNNDSTASYAWNTLSGTTGTAATQADLTSNLGLNAGVFIAEIFIPNYAGTTFLKAYRGQGWWTTVSNASAAGSVDHLAGIYNSTAAITEIDLFLSTTGNFNVGSRFSLYGIS